jgi:hypothetical protein
MHKTTQRQKESTKDRQIDRQKTKQIPKRMHFNAASIGYHVSAID